MCGIVGVYNFDRNQGVEKSLFVAQTDSLQHRGPDAGGVWIGDGVALGHRRLSIIDLYGGQQPMWDREKRIAIVFNGEIYNYRELKTELQQLGHVFASDSDTETIIHAYREWGSNCVDRLRGMFAFAILDAQQRTIFLARDRLGKKPLYYFLDKERLIFASEIKAIVTDSSVRRKLKPSAVIDYFAYNYVPGPGTIFQGIQKLPAGHSMFVDQFGIKTRSYWDIDFSTAKEVYGIEQAALELREQIEDAIRLRLRSDVPLGAFLSGGIDSSFVTGLMASLGGSEVLTHTIGFEEQAYDERAYARETADLFGCSHFEKVMAVDSTGIIEALSWFYDEPFGDSSAIPTYYLCQATRERVKVALSGDGGDENFAGYRRYRFAMAEHLFREQIPSGIRKPLFSALGRMYPKADYLPRYLRAKATFNNIAQDHERAYFLSLTQKSYPLFLNKDFLASCSSYDPYIHFERHLANAKTTDPLSRLQYLDLKLYLCDDILVKVDRASMAHGLEVRVPLLDHEAVEFAASLPSHYKLQGSESKRVLKRAAQSILPPSVFKRVKKGFSVPLPEWFRGDLRAPAEAVFFDQAGGKSGLLDDRGLKRMWTEHQRGLRNHATSLWSILMFEHWAARFLLGTVQAGPPVPLAQPTQILQ